jgi:hypothetical protein
VYRLQVKFSERYPLEPPEVVFVPPCVPVHEHIYSNGHICLGGPGCMRMGRMGGRGGAGGVGGVGGCTGRQA